MKHILDLFFFYSREEFRDWNEDEKAEKILRVVEGLEGEVSDWRASEASETLSGVYKFELVRYIYIYIYTTLRHF